LYAEKVYMEFPALIEKIKNVSKEFKNNVIRIEPKASGQSIVQHLKSITDLNVVYTKTPKDDKLTRLSVASPSVEGGKVLLKEAHWNIEFINEVCGFPNAKHDEYVDLLGYAIDLYFRKNTFAF
jgi:predicted phage terminase large subunit-like protein